MIRLGTDVITFLLMISEAERSQKRLLPIEGDDFFFFFSLELIPRRRGVSHSDPLPPHVSSPGVFWSQVERFQVLLNHIHPSLLLPSSAAKSLCLYVSSDPFGL